MCPFKICEPAKMKEFLMIMILKLRKQKKIRENYVSFKYEEKDRRMNRLKKCHKSKQGQSIRNLKYQLHYFIM
jgi:hypothetical protein